MSSAPRTHRTPSSFIDIATLEGQVIRLAPCVVGAVRRAVFGVVVDFQLMLRIVAFDNGEFTYGRL
jgi:hypothetical protein